MSDPTIGSLDVAGTRYARAVTRALARSLDTALAGVYLYGSATTGDFMPGRSDIDLVAVVTEPVGAGRRRAVVDEVARTFAPHAAKGLDLYVVPLASAARAARRPRFELRLLTEHGVAYGEAGGIGEERLVLHYACCRDHGRALVGHHPAKVFAPQSRREYIRQLRDEIDRSLAYGALYQVLNACRDWRYLEEGRICSKLAGAQWAQSRLDADSEHAGVVAAAIAARVDPAAPAPADAPAARFVQHVADLLDGANVL